GRAWRTHLTVAGLLAAEPRRIACWVACTTNIRSKGDDLFFTTEQGHPTVRAVTEIESEGDTPVFQGEQ
ncbi:MAG: hypothetical protein ABJC89_25570, partial [Acidobacteriota bacterium]